MYFFRTPDLFKRIYPRAIWHGDRKGKVLYLTFDDGPVPGVTSMVLDILREFGAKATFFCVGDNIRKHPAVFERMINEGHAVGNHTMHHLDGWKFSKQTYLDNIRLCDEEIGKHTHTLSQLLFRPPYGRISAGSYRKISSERKIIMWDVLSYDFSQRISRERALKGAISNTLPGSIVLFHDSERTRDKIYFLISQYIRYFANMDYQFFTINQL